jgi:pyridoxal phosphate enzyme (YggS family)
VALVAVTKGFGAEAIDACVAAGCTDIGENYAQEAVVKWTSFASPPARLHFIGRLQTNKVRVLAPHVALWQSIDRAALVDAVAKDAPGARVLVQVNVSDEPAKGGCPPGTAEALVDHARAKGLVVEGLMTVGRTGPPADAAVGFAVLRGLVDRLGLSVCSMGMSDDLEIAVAEGATMVRIGSALLGMRPSHPPAELA